MKKYIIGAIVGIIMAGVIGIVGGYLYVSGGYYNIASTEKHPAFVLEIIEITREASIARHAKTVEVLEEYPDSLAGFASYDAMCLDCHGAPGIGRSEFGQGLYPQGPALAGIDTVWNDRELFWIVKHGIKMTGMPAFGNTHNDSQLWEVVVFAKHLSRLGYYGYIELQDSPGGLEHGH